ncbi:PASTA domain-containing protein [Pseudofrankia asymbiotica]|uniref:PASTA domain-containing protein n=1 Tax=Pseudofrankia asymbiotica TaxID=1834516 RepID=A0A1V2II33_9ACTN|nr:PASTA domain-containing protein [Pseudofrankia asymbiotica]ONH32843.1 hypothetical protein BL253_03745 [Pseudofrankia asymbiotica]
MKLTQARADAHVEAADLATVDWLRAAADEVRATAPHSLVPAALAAVPAARRHRRLATVVPVTATAFTVAAVVTGTVLLSDGGHPAGPVPITAVSRPLVVTTGAGGTQVPGAPSPGATATSGPVSGQTATGPASAGSAGPSSAASPPRATPKPTLATVTVPDVIGQAGDAARAALRAAGFSGGLSQSVICAGSDIPAGVVTAQRPSAGSQADRQVTISLTVAGNCVAVPNVVGTAADTANTTLQNAGFAVTYGGQWNCEYGYNGVTAQSPAGGTRVVKGSAVMIDYTCAAAPLSTTPGPS